MSICGRETQRNTSFLLQIMLFNKIYGNCVRMYTIILSLTKVIGLNTSCVRGYRYLPDQSYHNLSKRLIVFTSNNLLEECWYNYIQYSDGQRWKKLH